MSYITNNLTDCAVACNCKEPVAFDDAIRIAAYAVIARSFELSIQRLDSTVNDIFQVLPEYAPITAVLCAEMLEQWVLSDEEIDVDDMDWGQLFGLLPERMEDRAKYSLLGEMRDVLLACANELMLQNRAAIVALAHHLVNHDLALEGEEADEAVDAIMLAAKSMNQILRSQADGTQTHLVWSFVAPPYCQPRSKRERPM